jgi:hypothetical protein
MRPLTTVAVHDMMHGQIIVAPTKSIMMSGLGAG